jgi:hypothetical protein
MTREPVYAAVFQFFAGLTAGNAPLFKVATRKPTTWESVEPEDQPALLLRQRSEHAEHRKFLPTKWTLSLDLMLFVHTGAANDPDVTPAQLLNPLLDAIEASIVIDDFVNGACTLGGLVSYCALDGTVELFLGSLGDEAVAIVPIKVLVNT